jgi:hypothetical protein
MKKNSNTNQAPEHEPDLLPEYRFDYSKARPNRFAAQLMRGSRAVVLDPDVAAVFSTPESVNAVLRALIETMPQKPQVDGKMGWPTECGGSHDLNP